MELFVCIFETSKLDQFLVSKKLADQSMTYPIGNIDRGHFLIITWIRYQWLPLTIFFKLWPTFKYWNTSKLTAFSLFSVLVMEPFIDDQAKHPRKRQMSKEKRLLANRHERERVRKMNDAYEELRSTIPNYEETGVKTKLELVQIATNYIQTLKEHLQSIINSGYNSSMNQLTYPLSLGMECNGTSKPAHRNSDYPYPPLLPVPPLPTSQLNLRHIGTHKSSSNRPHFPRSMTSPMVESHENSTHDFCGLFSSSLNDLHLDEDFLYHLQV